MLLLLSLLPFIGSLVAALLPTHARTAAASWAGTVSLFALGICLAQFPAVRDGIVLREKFTWVPAADLVFTLRMDGFAWLFASLVTGMGALVALYARYYLSSGDPTARFFSFLLAFMGAMLGVALSGNLIQLAFYWELTSLFSFLLIGYWMHRDDARRGARMALTVTGAGGLCLLVGLLMLGSIVGSHDLDAVLGAGDRVREHPWYPVMLVLVLSGAMTKSAQFPFHFWLPRAMAAPTPVSAYLHSATMVKLGVFLMARFWPVMSGTELWFWLVGGAGLLTLLLGAFFAMFQQDLKGLLAYSTISHLGLITLLLGLSSDLGAVAGVFHLINHATFKASLFMATGIIDHETGTRDLRRLRGLIRAMPQTGALAIVASAAMAGVPLLNGFLSKEMFFAEAVLIDSAPWVRIALPALATLAGAFAVAYSLRFAHGVFFGPPATDLPRAPHEPPWLMRVPVELLVITCLLVGVFPQAMIGSVLATSAAAVVGGDLPAYSLSIWHGVTPPLLMSLVALVVGYAGYRWLQWRERRTRPAPARTVRPASAIPGSAPKRATLDGQRIYERLTLGITIGSRRMLRIVATQRLQVQMACIVVTAMLAAALALARTGISWGDRPLVPGSIEVAMLWLVGCCCALTAAWQAKFHRLAALLMLSGAGLVVCLTWIWFSAPDLALTQLAVEVVTAVLFLLGLRWLPRRVPVETPLAPGVRLRRIRDLVLAAAAGTGMAVLAYGMMTRRAPQSISPFYLENAVPGGGGTNVVNVILVDFRSLDTLGEITVLGAVALTVYALLRRFRPAREAIEQPAQQRRARGSLGADLVRSRAESTLAEGVMMVPAVLVGLLFPIALVMSVHLFLRGHNEPGGGFVAGILVAIAFITQYLMWGTNWVEARVTVRPVRWIGTGLAFAFVTGAGAWWFGYPFLTTHTAHLALPVFGEVHVASALAFDIGVFAVVVGSTLLILIALAHQSRRARRRATDDGRAAEAEAAA
jgi:multicomponent K+:H+ antiporter subunit A